MGSKESQSDVRVRHAFEKPSFLGRMWTHKTKFHLENIYCERIVEEWIDYPFKNNTRKPFSFQKLRFSKRIYENLQFFYDFQYPFIIRIHIKQRKSPFNGCLCDFTNCQSTFKAFSIIYAVQGTLFDYFWSNLRKLWAIFGWNFLKTFKLLWDLQNQ